MGKRKTSNIFQDDDDSDDDDEFMKYVKERTEQSRKKARSSAIHTQDAQLEISKDELPPVDLTHNKQSSLGSKYMNQLLESKKRRELDLAHAQSLKVRLEKEFGNHANAVELITEGYKQKKEEFEKTEKLVNDQDSKEQMGNPTSALGPENVTLKMLRTHPSPTNYYQSFEGNTDHSDPIQTVHYSNDVYVNKSLLHKPGMRESLNYIDTIWRRERVKIFLQSEKTQQDISVLVQQYWQRHNHTNN